MACFETLIEEGEKRHCCSKMEVAFQKNSSENGMLLLHYKQLCCFNYAPLEAVLVLHEEDVWFEPLKSAEGR